MIRNFPDGWRIRMALYVIGDEGKHFLLAFGQGFHGSSLMLAAFCSEASRAVILYFLTLAW
jgi:hypothetical protein